MQTDVMHNSDFNPGTPHTGLFLMSLTIILQVISMSTLNQAAALCTILAALSTVAVNLRRFLKGK